MKKLIKLTTLSSITKRQKQLLFLIYKFRFLNTHQLQKLIGHKNPNRTLTWLKDLKEKGYIKIHYNKDSFESRINPAIYYLTPKARLVLKQEKELDYSELEYIYKESSRTKKFIEHSLFLVDVYLFFLSQKDNGEEIKFFTKADLRRYTYFPNPMPDAFISMIGKDITRHYFLDFFDEYTPPFVLRQRMRMYLDYVEKSNWDENTNSTPFPKILFICPNESLKTHIKKYSKALLEKTYTDKIKLFLTTKTRIGVGEVVNMWQKVE